MTERIAIIYVLCDSRESDPIRRVRYVGRTVRTPETRLRHHWRYANGEGACGHRAAWMRSVVAGGGQVVLEVIARVPVSVMDAVEVEHIAKYRALGCDLTNKTDGGGGALGYRASEETRRKLRVSHLGNTSHLGSRHSAETREMIRRQRLGSKASPESIAKISAALRGEGAGAAKLTWAEAESIRTRYLAGGVRQTDLAREFQVSASTVHLIVHRKTWVAA